MNPEEMLPVLVFLSPALIGVVIAFARPALASAWTDQFGQWAARKRTAASEKSGAISKYIWKPFLWGLEKIDVWTRSIEGEFVRAGVRAGSYTYYVSASIAVILSLAYVAVIVIVVIAVALLALWLIGTILGGGEGRSNGYSEKRTGFFGNEYVQHYDESGKEVGHSEEREGFFGGKYTQHHDQAGNEVGYSEEHEGFLSGKYVAHHDQTGSEVGTSDERESLLGGKYFQHFDKEGNETGYSEQREGFLGNQYVQHHDQKDKKC
jgi:hypothetical protein